MDLYDKIERTRHLGELFLIWLWHHADIDDGIFRLSDGTVLELRFDNQITLEAKLAQAEKTNLSGGAPADSREAREALKDGKSVTQAKMRIVLNEKEWVFVLNAQHLAISGLKIPALMTKADDEKLYERQFLIEEVDALIRGLYDSFLNLRLDAAKWKSEARAISQWVEASV